MKECNKCKELKPFSSFNKCKASKGGMTSYCKNCLKKDRQTIPGLVSKIYNTQKRLSKIRNHPPPSYDKKTMKKWLLENPLFEKLFDSWKNSGHEKALIPSIDRKNDNLPYMLDNIQLMTWKENQDKAHADRRSGKTIINHKAVIQYTADNMLIAEYPSARQAGRATGIVFQNISLTCRGIYESAGGFKWRFK